MGAWISLHEAEKYLNCGTARIRAALAEGGFDAYRLGKDGKNARYVCNTDDIDSWVRSQPKYPTNDRAVNKASENR